MGIETVKRCDVTGKILPSVIKVVVTIVELPDDDTICGSAIYDKELYVCDEAIARLKKFIIRGTTPPKGKVEK